MNVRNLSRRILLGLRRRLEPLAAPAVQARAAARVAADPGLWMARADAAIARGVAWFAPQQDLTMSALYILWRSWRRGAEPRFAFVEDRIARYRRTIRDPALRLFDPTYDPDAPEHRRLPDIMEVRPYLPIELMMIEAVWADVRDPGADFLGRIAAIDDGAGYGATHIVVAADLMKRSGAYPAPVLDALMAPVAAPMARSNRRTPYAGDIFAERIVMLRWMGRDDLCRPGWTAMLIDRQNPDGGWSARGVPPEGLSNQHTTCLALAALAEHRMAERAAR
ncbi:MAG: hypothetical protein EA355_09585 [Rhodobacteraceae bacterium]|nr:MAG: hypothetical protein EA355_09585 [Paracoccaceae bacterium]